MINDVSKNNFKKTTEATDTSHFTLPLINEIIIESKKEEEISISYQLSSQYYRYG